MAVDVVFRKYDGSLHRRVCMRRLGTDAYGTWLGAAAGTVVHADTQGFSYRTRHTTLRLVPADDWWCAIFFARPSEWDVYCDITTPAQWTDSNEVTMVDLDLDVLRHRNGRRVELLDSDEFDEHRVRFGYPDDVVEHATAAARRIHLALVDRTEPFAAHYRPWLGKAAH